MLRRCAPRNDRGVVLHRWRVLGVMAGEKRQPRTFCLPEEVEPGRVLMMARAALCVARQSKRLKHRFHRFHRLRHRLNELLATMPFNAAETMQRPAVVKCAAGERGPPAGHLACCRDKARKHGQTRPPTHGESAVGAGRPDPPPDLSLLPAGGIAVRLPTLMPEDRDAKCPLFSSGFARVRGLRR